MKLSNKTYDILKWAVMIALPAFATFYTTVGKIWGWPLTEEIVATIMAGTTFLGISLQISSAKHKAEDTK